MEVTLKKASDLSRAALDAAKAIEVASVIPVSIYSQKTVTEVVTGARKQAADAVQNVLDLITAAYGIRGLIGEANAKAGINAAITEQAFLDAIEKRLSGIGTVAAFDDSETDLGEVEAQLAAMKAQENRYTSSVSVRIFDAGMVETMRDEIATVKRQKADLRDKIAGLNLTTRVTLPPNFVATLVKHKILD